MPIFFSTVLYYPKIQMLFSRKVHLKNFLTVHILLLPLNCFGILEIVVTSIKLVMGFKKIGIVF